HTPITCLIPAVLSLHCARRDLHSFPTRRSSDLGFRRQPAGPSRRRAMRRTATVVLALAVAAAGCTKRVHERPILGNGDRVMPASDAVERARADARRQEAETTGRRDEVTARALETCAPAICDAIARGELVIGMNETQVLAATGTTESAWSVRDGAASSVMVPATRSMAPRDAVGEIAIVQLRNGRVQSYSYRESQGLRVVSSEEDATTDGRARALADALLREGDDYA